MLDLGLCLGLGLARHVTLTGNLAYDVHAKMFNLALHDLRLIHYCGILLTKLLVSVFFFIPWVAIQLVARKRKA